MSQILKVYVLTAIKADTMKRMRRDIQNGTHEEKSDLHPQTKRKLGKTKMNG